MPDETIDLDKPEALARVGTQADDAVSSPFSRLTQAQHDGLAARDRLAAVLTPAVVLALISQVRAGTDALTTVKTLRAVWLAPLDSLPPR